MTVKSAQAIVVLFTTQNPTTGAAADATGTPVGTLYVNGTANAAVVTVTNITTGVYKAALTLPTLTAGQIVSLRVAATVEAVAGEGVVWQDVGDTYRISDLASNTLVVQSPVASNLAVTTYQGDDYDTADGRQLSWTVLSTATLTGGTVAVILSGVATYVGTIVSETSITLDLTAVQTLALPVGQHKYQVIVTQTPALGSDKITVAEGPWSHKARMAV